MNEGASETDDFILGTEEEVEVAVEEDLGFGVA